MTTAKKHEAGLRHASYYLSVLQRDHQTPLDSDDPTALDQDWENLKRAQAWAASSANEDAARLCVDYANYGYRWLLPRLRLREVLGWSEDAVAAAKKLGSPQTISTSIYALGRAHSVRGDYRKAIEYYEQFLTLARDGGTKDVEAMALFHLADACGEARLTERAIAYYEQGLRLTREMQSKAVELGALVGRGKAYQEYGDQVRAAESYRAALALLQETDAGSLPDDSDLTRGNIHLNLGNYREAIECFESLLHSAAGKPFQKMGVLSFLARAYWGASDIRRAISTYEQLLSLSLDLNMVGLEADTLNELADVYLGNGDLKHALACHQRALGLFEEFGEKHAHAQTLHSIGLIYERLGDTTQKIRYSEEALQLADEDTLLWLNIKLSLAMTYSNAGDRARATALVEHELERAAATRDPLREARALIGAASVYLNGGDNKRAVSSAEEAVNKSKPYGAVNLEGDACGVLLSAYLNLSDTDNALRVGRRSLELLEASPALVERQRILRGLYGIYLQMKDYEGALDCARRRLENARLVSDKRGEGEALVEVGAVSLFRGDREQARPLISEGLAALSQHGSPMDVAQAHFVIALAHEVGGDIEQAISLCERAVELTRDDGDYHGARHLWEALARVIGKSNDAERRLRFHQQYLDFALRNQDSRQAVKAFYGLAGCFYLSQDYEKAVVHYRRALELAREAGERVWEHSSCGALGRSLEEWARQTPAGEQEAVRAHLRAAVEYYGRQLELAAELDDLDGKLMALGGLGTAHGNLKELSQAAAYLEERLALALAAGRSELAETVDVLALVYVEAGQTERALGLYETRLADCRASADDNSVPTYLIGQGMIFGRARQTQRAVEVYELAAETARRLGDEGKEGTALYGKALILSYQLDRYSEAITLTLAASEKMRRAGALPVVLDSLANEISQWQQRVR